MNKAKLIELQKTADDAKYLKGFEEQYDPSGSMDFCEYCKYKNGITCDLYYTDRLACLACGQAYAKYVKAMLDEILPTENK